ncbi:MAG: T9SS type A sorting domain-containing protein [Saprospiraceae bacterium]
MNQFKSTILKIVTFFTFVLGIHTSSYGQFEQVYPSEYVSSINQIAFHDSGLAIALLRCDGIMRSTDHGNSWTYIEIAGMASQNNIIFIDNDPKKILISGTYAAYTSDDGGLTFQPFSYVGIPTDGLRRSIIQLENGDFLFLSRGASAISKDLISWNRVVGFSASNYELEDKTLFCAAGKTLIRSLDNVATFDTMEIFQSNIIGMDYKDGLLILSLLDNTVFISSDAGITFNEINHPTTFSYIPLIINKDHFVFFNERNVTITKDGGTTYNILPFTEKMINGIEGYSVRGDGKIYAFGNSLKFLHSSDQGENWELQNGRLEDFVAIGSYEHNVAVGGDKGGISFSNDDGMTWTDVTGNRERIVDIQPLPNGNIYYVDVISRGHYIDKSGNELNTFQFNPGSFNLYCNDGKLFNVINDTKGIIYASEDNGATWQVAIENDEKIISFDFISDTKVVIVTYNGHVYYTDNGGGSWEELYNFNANITQASFKSKNEGIWFSGSKMYGTDDGFVTVQETAKPYNGLRFLRSGDKTYCLGANSSATFMYEFTGLLANKGVNSGCVPHKVGVGTSSSIIIAGTGGVIERLNTKPSSSIETKKDNYRELSSFPNPTDGHLFFENISDGTHVNITNTMGNSFIKTISGNQVDVSDLPSGLYIVTMAKNGWKYRGKFLRI